MLFNGKKLVGTESAESGDSRLSRLAGIKGFCVAGLVLVASTGCFPMKQARVASVALTLQDVARAASKQSDPVIVAEGTPAYLMLVDGLIEAYPENRDLLVAGCQAYVTYASSFVADDAPPRAGRLYLTAKLYGFRALTAAGHGDFSKAAVGNVKDFEALLGKTTKSDVPALFWTANAWANWIGLNLGSVEAVADLPALEALMKRVIELDGSYYYGSPHVLMGVYESSKPAMLGGSTERARAHFERASQLGADKMLSVKVLYAEYYARAVKDEALFVKTLEGVLAEGSAEENPELTLSNTLARKKAEKLLSKREEYFAKMP